MCLQANTTMLLKIKQIYLQQKYKTTIKKSVWWSSQEYLFGKVSANNYQSISVGVYF